ncbi:ATP-binding protein [Geobacter pelophilus]|uniref:ATP-binding protein n=1 Tax=Geoanaerobacter pelophilus TaxID=60036 RepID=A0AAW4L578_9BACT|nr:ATP-binding protein [Geoanaerobacter pelophilus]MBT0666379.1 ATP-binding protein [Geoanaerobacter pelophilus]
MRHQMVKTKDVKQADQAIADLLNTENIERMGVFWGLPGTGKTTAVAHLANLYDGVYIRALGCSSVTSVLGDICLMLGGKRLLRRSDMVEYICHHLTTEAVTNNPVPPRPIFVDEADYCFRQVDILDSLRDIYDISGCPVILIGMENIARTIRENGRFARRITQWIEFVGIDIEDATQVAAEVCEVQVQPDLIDYLWRETSRNIGRFKIGLDKIEKFALSNGAATISRADWGNRPLYYDQPNFGKLRK